MDGNIRQHIETVTNRLVLESLELLPPTAQFCLAINLTVTSILQEIHMIATGVLYNKHVMHNSIVMHNMFVVYN